MEECVRNEQTQCLVACVEQSFVLEFLFFFLRKKKNTYFFVIHNITKLVLPTINHKELKFSN